MVKMESVQLVRRDTDEGAGDAGVEEGDPAATNHSPAIAIEETKHQRILTFKKGDPTTSHHCNA